MKKRKKSVKIIDDRFDDNKDVVEFFDRSTLSRPNQSHRINLELPEWMLKLLDIESTRLGVPRQAVIKFILDEKLKKVS